MGYLKIMGMASALAVTGLGLTTGVANADAPFAAPAVTTSIHGGIPLDNWGYGPGYDWGGAPGYPWAGAPGYGYGPNVGYYGPCAWIPPVVSVWIPPAVCGG